MASGLRISEAEAIRKGWIDKPLSKPNEKAGSKLVNTAAGTPQHILFESLKQAYPDLPVQWEKAKLIPNRRFQTDLFLPPNLIIEVDGFKFHRSKSAFQADRDRQNLFVENSFWVLRYYTKQILSESRRRLVMDQIYRVYTGLQTGRELCRGCCKKCRYGE